MTGTGIIGKATRLVAAAIFAAGLLAAPQPAEAVKPGDLGARKCYEAFNSSPAGTGGFCPHVFATHSGGVTTNATCTLDARCRVVVPVSTGENAYVTFEEQVDATHRFLVTNQLNLCLKPGSTQRLEVREREGGPDGRLTRLYYRNLTNYTLHLRTICESGETDAGAAASNGLGQ